MEVAYYDIPKEIRLSAYADTVICDRNGTSRTLVGIRLGGYPEMVSALSTAILGGATISIKTETEHWDCTAEPKHYAKTQVLTGTYAVQTMLWDDDAAQKAAKQKEESEENDDADTTTNAPQKASDRTRQSYLLCAPDDRETLYHEIDERSIVPMLSAFTDYLIDELQRRSILTRCEVWTTGKPFEAWRLTCTADDANIAKAVTDGLKKGAITIPGATPAHAKAFQDITGVTSYLNAVGPTLAARIRCDLQGIRTRRLYAPPRGAMEQGKTRLCLPRLRECDRNGCNGVRRKSHRRCNARILSVGKSR